ncbi:Retrovirus-related Pol polyprotein from type-2 retrotransposable element R2DM [Portunus trituberculatus]|uniref:Retrovirus-related Pol polyprotein from type-2 retrotransposable element R2DM n=1 Tax=Portunus trituberculatus TaxID=210409 RepID=A0A5B7E6V2_PORTR|nr:Retrovirus-related Pol polyprotein from type-2 retrotransposable element R2DM [Portunus trituberculatus]
MSIGKPVSQKKARLQVHSKDVAEKKRLGCQGLFGRSSIEEIRLPEAVRPTLEVAEIERSIKTTKPSTAPGPDSRRQEPPLNAASRCHLMCSSLRLLSWGTKVGLKLGIPKCGTHYIRSDGKRKRWLMDTRTTFSVIGVRLKALQLREVCKSLGLEVGVAMGQAETKRAIAALVKGLGSLQKAPLKPQEKLWGLKSVIIPKQQYKRALLSTSNLTYKEMHESTVLCHKTQLYASTHGRGLSGTDESPPTHE